MPKESFDLSATLNKMRVLAIDDMVEARTALKKMMSTLGVKHIDICNDGEEASNCICMNRYDLIISDYNLGKGKDGQQVLEEAKFSGRLKASSTFIMLTGESTPEMVMGALEYEPDDYITKPFTVDIVRKRLSRILQVKGLLSPITQAIDKEDFELAIKESDLIIKNTPKLFFKVMRLKTQILMQLNRYTQALSCFESVIEQRELPWALLGKARCLSNTKDYKSAKSILNDCLIQYPKYVQCLDELAKISVIENKLIDAQSYLQKGVNLSPKAILRQAELGEVAFKNKDMKVAESALKQALKLAKNSYYKDPKIILMLAKSMQHKIDSSNSKESSLTSQDLFKAINEGKDIYSSDDDFKFEAAIIESNTFVNLGKDKEAQEKSKEAESLMANINNIDPDMQLLMAENFFNTGQSYKGEKLLKELEESGVVLPSDFISKHQGDKKSLEEGERYSTKINEKAIKFYQKGDLENAIALFDQAVAHKEAGVSVLLNAIQAKVSYMESNSLDHNLIKECEELFNRVGVINAQDERYDRYKKLKASFEKITKGAV